MKRPLVRFTPEAARLVSKFHPETRKLMRSAIEELRRNPLKTDKKPLEGTSTRMASHVNSAKAITTNTPQRIRVGVKIPLFTVLLTELTDLHAIFRRHSKTFLGARTASEKFKE